MSKTRQQLVDEFNSLPIDVRTIACGASALDSINYLLRERRRLVQRHLQSMKEINDHIKNHKIWLKREYGVDL